MNKKLKNLAKKWDLFVNRNKRYTVVHRDGLNILVETEESKYKSEKRRSQINTLFSFVSAVAAIVAAVFAALTYINS